MSTMTQVITPTSSGYSYAKVEEKQNFKIDYDYFFTAATKARTANYLRKMGDKIYATRGKAFKFSNGNPNPACFPYEEVSVKLKNGDSFQIDGEQLADGLSYLSTNGYQPLLNMLKTFQDRWHGVQDWKKKNLTTTAGSQSGLQQIMEAFVSPGDPLLIQSPVYTGFISILKHLNMEFLEVDRGADGICVDSLRNMLYDRKRKNLPMPKIFYINPVGTNPTGDITSTEKKKEIYKIACDYNFLIVEDDPYYLLTYNPNEPIISFLSLDTQNRVVRFDTISKTIGAGFRIGFVTAATEVIQKLNLIKESSNMCAPFCQIIAYETLKSMGFEGFAQHVNFVTNFYFKNRQVILKSLDKYLGDVATWIVPEAAMFVWLTVKNIDHIPESFVQKCLEHSVLIIPGLAFYAKDRISPCIRLAFSMVNEDEIEEGIEIFARLIKEELLKCY